MMKFFRNSTFILVLLVMAQVAAAQKVLTGKVVDSNKEPLPGANIYIVNQSNRSLAGNMVDVNGNYRIVVPNEQNLKVVFSFIGFKTQVIDYTGQSNINITLEEESKVLETVDITAKKVEKNSLGITQREQVTATQKITLDKLETAPVTSITEALQGALANVDILTGADPGSKTSIRIRGTSSLNASSEPLFVVDGVAYPVDVASDFNFATATTDDYSNILNISPNDIESVEVLKDAAATAVWGSKGANGVLLFKTKKGSKGRIKFTASTKMEFRKEPNTIPMLDAKQYISMIQDAIYNTVSDLGYTSSNSLTYLNLMYNTKEIGYDPAWLYFDEYNQNTNWLNEITRVGYSVDNSFSMSGGGEKATYRLSLGYASDQGITIGTQFDRFNALFNVQYKFSDRLDVSTDIRYTQGIRQANWDNPRGEALTKMPNMSPYTIGDDGKRTNVYFTPNSYFQGNFSASGNELNGRFNPVALVHEAESRTVSNSGRVAFNLHYQIFKDLDYYGIVGLDIDMNKYKKYLPQEVTGVTYVNEWFNHSLDALSDKFLLQTENKFIYSKLFTENHKILLSGIFQTREQINSASSFGTSGSPSSSVPTSENIRGMGSGISTTRELGFILNGHYTLMNRYMFNAGYRLEANSSIGKENRVGGFPVLGVAWIANEESFLKDIQALSLAKLRLSWGQSGNTPGGSYPYIGIYSPLSNSYIDMNPVAPVNVQLDNLKWETVTQTNAGLDLGLWNNKLNVTFEAYYKLTTDMLHKDVSIPATTGYTTVKYINSGSMSNKGWELIVNYEAIKTTDFSLQLSMNMAQNINKIIDIPSNQIASSYTVSNGTYAYRIIAGDPLGSFYGFRCLGVYQNVDETYARDVNGNIIYDIGENPVVINNVNSSNPVYPGDAKYEDVNYDGIINQYDIVYLGNSMPLSTGGFGFNIRYKNLGLIGNFQGRLGQKIINKARIDMENMYGRNNQSVAVLRRWRHEGDDTEIPRALFSKGYNYLGSDRFVEDGSFLRLKTITIKYALPKLFVQRLGLTRADIYATAYDLWTITGYTGQDPEVSLSNNLAYDKAITPKPIRVAGGIIINF